MNLEEKSEEYAGSIDCNIYVKGGRYVGYKAGYNECKSDLLDFLKANPKADNKQITEYLNSL